MNRLAIVIFGLAGACVASLASAQVTLYEQEGFHGRTLTANSPIHDLGTRGFSNRAASIIVDRGDWQVCEETNFRGRCIVLRPGQYASLRTMDMQNRISSLRRVGHSSHYVYAPLPPPAPPYPYYPHYAEHLYTADVVDVRAVMGPPEQRCWVEQQQVAAPAAPNVGGAILGGVLGGVIGHQIGSGTGRTVATAVGAVAGTAVGANVNRGTQTYTQDVQHCASVPGTGQVAYWDVTYVFRGATHRAQLSYAPGRTITVNGRGEPRV